MDGSKRSGKSNAFCAGLCGERRVVIFDTLLDLVRKDHLLDVKHIVAVLGHEIGHAKHIRSLLYFIIFFCCTFIFCNICVIIRYLETVRNIVGECFPWFLWVFVGLFTGSYL
jgi:Zn-dependent protease with chaperone function